MSDNNDVFGEAIGGGLKTYITAGVGVVLSFLSGFNILNLTDKQTVSLTGAIIFLAFIFTRMAIWKAHKTGIAALAEASASKDASNVAAGAATATVGIVTGNVEAATISAAFLEEKAKPTPTSNVRRRKKTTT